MAKPPKFHRRNGVYYYRARVPTDVLRVIGDDPATWRRHTRGGMLLESWKDLVGKGGKPKNVLWVSLRQSNRKEAEFAFARKQVELNDLFAAVLKVFRRQGTNPTMADVERLARDWFNRMEAKQAAHPPSSSSFNESQDDEIAFRLEEELALAKGFHASYNDPDEQFGDPNIAAKLLIEPGFIVDDASPEFVRLSELVQRGYVELAKKAIDRQNRDFGRTHDEFFAFRGMVRVEPQPHAQAPGEAFASLVQEYVAERKLEGCSPKTLTSYEISFRVAKDVIGSETPATSITRDDWKRFVQTLKELPTNYTKRKTLKGLDAVEAAKRSRLQNLEPLSVSTVQGYIDHVSAMLDWAVREDKIAKNLVKGLSAGKETVAKEDRRSEFELTDLQAIFAHSNFGTGQGTSEEMARQRGARFWAPLIALFAGFRLNEILQMHLSDIELRQGVYSFVATLNESDGTRAPDKKLKNSSSRRVVPVHPELERIGFLRYCEQLKKTGQKLLFPEVREGNDGYKSTPYSKWFIRLLEQIKKDRPDFAKKGQTFHSFRHNFRDALREGGVAGELAHALGGWSLQTTGDRYGSGYRAKDLLTGLEKVRYEGLDLRRLYWP